MRYLNDLSYVNRSDLPTKAIFEPFSLALRDRPLKEQNNRQERAKCVENWKYTAARIQLRFRTAVLR